VHGHTPVDDVRHPATRCGAGGAGDGGVESAGVVWVGVNALDHWRANYLISPDMLGQLKFDSTAPHIWRRTTDRGKAAITAARLAGKERGAAEWQACEGGKVIRHWSEGMIRLWVLDEDKEMLRGVDWDLMIVPIGG